jgi:Opioid growth factor receptor (OGFr) conserved region
MSDDKLVRFYAGTGHDDSGRTLQDILNFDDEELEYHHDFIQWLFPTTQQSAYHPDAPTLDDAQVRTFLNDADLRQNVQVAFERMLNFYGFGYSEEDGNIEIAPGENWEERKGNWLEWGDHNHKRITRILTSLRLLGLPDQAAAFFRALDKVRHSPDGSEIDDHTFRYWQKAVR